MSPPTACASSSTACTRRGGPSASSRAASTRSSTRSPSASASTSGARTVSRSTAGALTGRVDGPIVDATAKAAALEEWAADAGVPLSGTVAVGDGANDLLMLDRAALGVAFSAKPAVRRHADVAIDRPDLSGVLALVGLRGSARAARRLGDPSELATARASRFYNDRMSSRTVARSLAIAGLTALLAATASQAAGAMTMSPPESTGSLVDRIALPNGFQPEGIAIDAQGTAYVGSLADGDIYAADVRSGEGEVIIQGPGTPSVGLKVDQRGRLFIAGGPTGTARVVDIDTGELLADYQLTDEPVVRERRRPHPVHAAWFTDSMQAQLYMVPLGPGGALPDADEIETLPLTGEWVQQRGVQRERHRADPRQAGAARHPVGHGHPVPGRSRRPAWPPRSISAVPR